MEHDFERLIHHPNHELVVCGVKVKVYDGVFTPDPTITNSTSLVLNNLPNLQGKTVLDMGTGTGVIAIICAKKGARDVIAVDSSEIAIENAQENIQNLEAPNITLVKSNLYQMVEGKFDYIFANLPILDEVWKLDESTNSLTKRFLLDSLEHLNEKGEIYLPGFSVFDVSELQKMVEDLGYRWKLITEEKLHFTWYLLILSL